MNALFGSDEFHTGLAFGAVALAVLLPVAASHRALTRRRGEPVPVPFVGLLVAVSAGAALELCGPLSAGMVVGVAGVALGCGVASRREWSVPATLLALLPFAWCLGFRSGVDGPAWLRAATTLGVASGAWGAARHDESRRSDATGPLLLAVSAYGCYLTVPDTEAAAAFLGVALVLAVAGYPLRLARLGAGGAGAAVGVMMWAAAAGAGGRPASMFGALGCLGLLVGEPIAAAGRALRPAGRASRGRARGPVTTLLVGHAAVVVVASRVAGPMREPLPALAVATLAVGSAVAVGRRVGRATEPRAAPEPA